jgi:signal transduction histidine kinase
MVKPTREHPPVERARALVVDDDPALLRTTDRMLANHGYLVETALDGKTALQKIEAGSFDVIVCDIYMPEMSGLELTEKIRTAGFDVPIILVTGNPHLETVIKAMERGVLRYLARPFTPQRLIGAVAEAVRLHGIERARQLALDNDALRTLVDELHRSQEAALAASRAKTAFLANMSHELRTPLNGIMGLTDLVLLSDLSPDQRKCLVSAKESASTLLGLINDLLDFAKIEAGKLSLEQINVPLREQIEDVLAGFAVLAHEKGLELALEVAPDVPDALIGDPIRLKQLLMNLVSNALKFTESGEVIVTVDADVRPGRAVVHIAVSDTGIGIPAEKLSAIFDPFVQADTSTARRFGGTGLGLAIAAELAHLMGGRIWAESDVRRGSTFHVAIDLQRAGADESPRIVSVEPKRVLVVDRSSTRSILTRRLSSFGLKAIGVEDFASAILRLREARDAEHPFDVVLLDARDEGSGGFSLAETIANEPALSKSMVMMLPTIHFGASLDRCRALGAGHLTKPIREAELLRLFVLRTDDLPIRKRRPSTRDQIMGAPGRSLRVLLAEDNPTNQLVATRFLQRGGHQVTTVADGKAAIARWEEDTFDVVLMDVQMPEVDGFEATKAIRSKEKDGEARTPIIAMTAHAMPGDRDRCLEAGMDDYVSKPLDFRALSDALERWAG